MIKTKKNKNDREVINILETKNNEVKNGVFGPDELKQLTNFFASATDNSIVELKSGRYLLTKEFVITKKIVVRAQGNVEFVNGTEKSINGFFIIGEGGSLDISGVTFNANFKDAGDVQAGISTPKDGLLHHYTLKVSNCIFKDFNEGQIKTFHIPAFGTDYEFSSQPNMVFEISPQWKSENDYVADFAKLAIEKESLGKDTITDFLAVSFSSTDYVGHILGPRSVELQDTYLRLDLTIADFLNYLDKTVGKGNYLVFLTADHAGAENARFLHDNKYDVTNLDGKELDKNLEKFSTDTFGEDLVLRYDSFNLFFDKNKIKGIFQDLYKQACEVE